MISQYIFIILWIGFMAMCAGKGTMLQEELQNGEKVFRVNWMFAFIAFLPVIIMAGERGWIADTGAYIMGYRSMPDSLSGIWEYMQSIEKDRGFSFVSAVMRAVMGYNYVPYLYAIALFQGIVLVWFFRKYSESCIFSIFLFLASTDYISWMFNGIRQFIAVCITLIAVPFIFQRRHVAFLITILIASTFHKSAILMIPFVYISLGEAWNKRTLLFIAGILVATTFVGWFTGAMDEILQHTQYKNVVSDYKGFGDNGTHPLRGLVYSMPAVIAFFSQKDVIKKGSVFINFCINMSIISAGLYIVAMVTSGIFIGRMPIYCSLFSYILLPWELNHVFGKYNRKFCYTGTAVCYLLFYYFTMHFQFGMI